MTEEKTKEETKKEKQEEKQTKQEANSKQEQEAKSQDKAETKTDKTTQETEKEKEKQTKKEQKQKQKKRDYAIAKGIDLPISTKHSIAICRFIKGKHPAEAIEMLEKVRKLKLAVPMQGEIPHRKGRIMSGRYPVKAAEYFIKVLKTVIANAVQLGLDESKLYISIAKADKASRPYRPSRHLGRRFKRTHLLIEVRELNKQNPTK